MSNPFCQQVNDCSALHHGKELHFPPVGTTKCTAVQSLDKWAQMFNHTQRWINQSEFCFSCNISFKPCAMGDIEVSQQIPGHQNRHSSAFNLHIFSFFWHQPKMDFPHGTQCLRLAVFPIRKQKCIKIFCWVWTPERRFKKVIWAYNKVKIRDNQSEFGKFDFTKKLKKIVVGSRRGNF